jgi:predicted nucleic acid-binding protein
VSREKSLILDANIIIRATLGIRVTDLLQKMSPFVRFFTPEICVADAYKYLPPLLQKRGIDEQTSIASLDAVVRTVNVLDKERLLDIAKGTLKGGLSAH